MMHSLPKRKMQNNFLTTEGIASTNIMKDDNE